MLGCANQPRRVWVRPSRSRKLTNYLTFPLGNPLFRPYFRPESVHRPEGMTCKGHDHIKEHVLEVRRDRRSTLYDWWRLRAGLVRNGYRIASWRRPYVSLLQPQVQSRPLPELLSEVSQVAHRMSNRRPLEIYRDMSRTRNSKHSHQQPGLYHSSAGGLLSRAKWKIFQKSYWMSFMWRDLHHFAHSHIWRFHQSGRTHKANDDHRSSPMHRLSAQWIAGIFVLQCLPEIRTGLQWGWRLTSDLWPRRL